MRTPNPTPPSISVQDIYRFWDKVSFPSNNSCWKWKASTSYYGYGQFHFSENKHRRTLRSHRVSYFLIFGIWSHQDILHRCDNPPCVNPFHLFEGSHLDNVRDMFAKGRRPPTRGSAKLSEAQVLTIRSLWRGRQDTRQLAIQFSVCTRTISDIVTRKRWRRV